MSETLTANKFTNKQAVTGLTTCTLAFVALMITQDFLRANLNNTGFYLSESFLFSTFWWLFAPLLFVQLTLEPACSKRLSVQFALLLLPLTVHLFGFPFLVWALSKTFYYHTFTFQQTLRYTLSEHLYQLILLYTVPFCIYRFYYGKTQAPENARAEQEGIAKEFMDFILVSENNKKSRIAVSEVMYFSASTPYISIHLTGKKYLQTETLKALSAKLDPQKFIRIHKSFIVHITEVVSYTSRLNGDYDLVMKNDETLRVSRNFAADFKRAFEACHHLTQK